MVKCLSLEKAVLVAAVDMTETREAKMELLKKMNIKFAGLKSILIKHKNILNLYITEKSVRKFHNSYYPCE